VLGELSAVPHAALAAGNVRESQQQLSGWTGDDCAAIPLVPAHRCKLYMQAVLL